MPRTSTFTTYINTALEPGALADYDRLEREGVKTFDSIAMAAARAGRASAGLLGGRGNAGLTTLRQQNRSVENALKSTAREQERAAKAADRNAKATANSGKAAEQAAKQQSLLVRSLQTASRSLNIAQGPLGAYAGRLNALGAALEQLTGFQLGLAGAGAGLFSLGSTANQFAEIEGRLRPLFDSQQDVNRALENLAGIAQRARTSLEPVIDIYTKLKLSADQFGISEDRLQRFVETTAKASTLSGGNRAGVDASLGQFSQALGSNFQNAAQEINSLRDQNIALLKAIADGFENVDGSIGTTIGNLKVLGEAGELSSIKIVEALERSAASVDERFGRLPVTLGKALTEFNNTLLITIGRFDQAVSGTSTLASVISLVGRNLNGILSVTLGIAAAFATIRAGSLIEPLRRTATSLATLAAAPATIRKVANELKATTEIEFTAARARELEARAEQQRSAARIAQLRTVAAQQERIARDAEVGARAGLGGTLTSQGLISQARANEQLTKAKAALNSELLRQQRLDLLVANNAGRSAKAGEAYAAATANAAAKSSLLRNATASLINVINPLGIAVGVVTGLLLAYATSASAAETALSRFSDEQRKAVDAIGATTIELLKQDAVLARREVRTRKADSQVLAGAAVRSRQGLAFDLIQLAGQTGIGGGRDRKDILNIARAVEQGAISVKRADQLLEPIRQRSPSVFKGNFVKRIFGVDPETIDDSIIEVEKANLAAKIAADNLNAAQAALAQAENGGPAASARPRAARPRAATAAELRAKAVAAAVDGGTDTIRAAGARRKAALLELDKEFAVANGKVDPARAEEYARRATEIERQYNGEVEAIKAGNAARRGAIAAGRRAEAAERREAAAKEKQERDAARRGERRSDILARYDEAPRAIDRARDEIDDLQKNVGQLVDEIVAISDANPLGRGIYTKEQADRDAASIERGVLKPLADAKLEFERQKQIQDLLLAGRDLEAEAYRRSFQLADQVGQLTEDQYQTTLKQVAAEDARNRLIEQRARLVSIVESAVDNTRQSLEDLIVDFPKRGFAAIGDFFNNLQQSFLRVAASKIVDDLFGNQLEKAKQDLTGRKLVEEQTQFLASKTAEAGTAAERLAAALTNATEQINQAAPALGGTAPIGGLPDPASDAASIINRVVGGAGAGGIFGVLSAALGGGAAARSDPTEFEADEIVVTAKRLPPTVPAEGQIPSGRVVFNEVGKSVGGQLDRIFGTGKIFKEIGGSVGDALQGVALGSTASGIAGAIGIKQSRTGAAVGGAIGGAIGGPLGSIIGGLLGGTIGGALKKTKTGSATIGGGASGLEVTGTAGSSQTRIKAASKAADGLISSVNQIAEQLGGGIDASRGNVSIGIREKNFRVDTSGKGITKTKKGAIDFGDDEQAAIEFAIKDLINDGVITGISQASQNILRAGKDLQSSIEKAAIIESIPRRLLQRTDPVRFAVEELNREFTRMIAILKEGGATSAQFADAQKLYELERADAIEQATKSAGDAISQYLADLTGGSASPLRKREVLTNARSELDKFTGDINAGKVVDQNDLLAAARNFQDASRNLNGSSQAFFDDFNFLFELLKRARDNAGVGDTVTNLPPSPFASDTTVQAAIQSANNSQVTAINSQTATLASELAAIRTSLDQLAVSNRYGGGTAIGLLGGAGRFAFR